MVDTVSMAYLCPEQRPLCTSQKYLFLEILSFNLLFQLDNVETAMEMLPPEGKVSDHNNEGVNDHMVVHEHRHVAFSPVTHATWAVYRLQLPE